MTKKFACPKCGKFALKQLTAKQGKNEGKQFWVCAGPQEQCGAFFWDSNGQPDLPIQDPKVTAFLAWFIEEAERMQALTAWEKTFVGSLIERPDPEINGDFYTRKQVEVLRSISSKFVNSPEF